MRDMFDSTQALLMRVTGYLLDSKPANLSEQGRPYPVVPYDKLIKFLEIITLKSKELHRESQYFQANLHVEMSEASIQLANTLLNVFTCVEKHLVELIYKKPVGDFPIRAFFIKEMP
jgi:hypothetical protein